MNLVSTLMPMMLAQATPESSDAAAAAAADVQIHSILDFVIKGGPVMIPIGLCSLIALTVLMERLVSLRRAQVIPASFLPGLRRVLFDTGANPHEALAYCRANDSPIARVCAAGLKRWGESTEVMERAVQEAGEREALRLRKYLRVLSVIGAIAPLLGLLGTITGMITAFQTVAASGEALGRTELLAKGIYEAMITTAAGLIVAIPVLIAYHWLTAKVDGLVVAIDSIAVEVFEELTHPESESASSAAPPRIAIAGNGEHAATPAPAAAV